MPIVNRRVRPRTDSNESQSADDRHVGSIYTFYRSSRVTPASDADIDSRFPVRYRPSGNCGGPREKCTVGVPEPGTNAPKRSGPRVKVQALYRKRTITADGRTRVLSFRRRSELTRFFKNVFNEIVTLNRVPNIKQILHLSTGKSLFLAQNRQ